jgi:hypothetical protein
MGKPLGGAPFSVFYASLQRWGKTALSIQLRNTSDITYSLTAQYITLYVGIDSINSNVMPSLVQILFLAALPIIGVAAFWSSVFQEQKIFESLWNTIQSPKVRLEQGIVVGKVLDDKFPAPVEGFMGLPYSQPPTGDRRLRRAVPLPASNETYYAKKYGPM